MTILPISKYSYFFVLFFYLCSIFFKSFHGAISPSLMVLFSLGLEFFGYIYNIHVCIHIRVYRENMFFKKKISATHNASACGLVRRNPKGFLISTMFRGSLSHLKFDLFYIADFHSVLTSQVSVQKS